MQRTNYLKKTPSLFLYLLVYYLIIGSDSIIFSYNRNGTMVAFGQYLMVAMALVFFSISIIKGKFFRKMTSVFLLVTMLSLVLSMVYYMEFSGGYISIVALFLLGACFFDVIPPESFKKAFLDIMTAIAVTSLLTFFLAELFLELDVFPVYYNTNDRPYHFFFLSNISTVDLSRNYGLFTEPSRYQAYLNLSLMFILFDKRKINIKRLVVFLLALITTFSTTGFIAFAFIFCAFLFSNKVRIKLWQKSVIIAGIAVAAVVLLQSSEDFISSLNKITMGQSDDSAATRFNSFFANLVVISENFLLGTGITNAEAEFASALYSLDNAFASTNTITILIYFAKFGVIPGLFYTLNMVKAVRSIGNGSAPIFLICAFIAMTCGISFIGSILFSIIAFYPGEGGQSTIREDKYAHIGN